MKTVRLLLLALLLAGAASAQNTATVIKTQALNMANAVIKNDFNTFVRYMHPNVIRFAGGTGPMKEKMDSAYKAMQQFGVTFKRYWIGDPGPIVTYNKQLQTTLPQSTTLITPMGEMTLESTLLVISNDNGKNWWFIDTNVYHADKVKSILPDLSPAIVLPPRSKPRFVPNGGKTQ